MIETSSDLPQSSVIFDNIWNFSEVVGKHFCGLWKIFGVCHFHNIVNWNITVNCCHYWGSTNWVGPSQCQYKHSVRPCAVIGLEWVQGWDYVWHKLRWGEKLCNCKIVAQSNNDTETLIKLNQHFPNSNEILGISEWVLVNSLVLRG